MYKKAALSSVFITASRVVSVSSILILSGMSFSATAKLCQQQICTIIGTNQADVLIGTEGNDVICGGKGNDLILGKQGNDLICGGKGKDYISGGDGDDILVGGKGADELEGGTGIDQLYGNQGADILFAEGGDDLLRGGTGKDIINGVRIKKCKNKGKRSKQCLEIIDDPIAYFKVIGNNIIHPDGGIFKPQGINIFPWHEDSDSISKITASCWNFNMVRLHAWILPKKTTQFKDHVVYVGEPVIFDPKTVAYSIYDVAPLIESYTSQGIVVLFDIHDYIGQYFEGQDLVDYLIFVKDFANRYKNNPYVWLDIHNEPGTYDGVDQDFSQWRTETIAIMDTVRAVAPNMIALISGTAWGQDTGPRWNGNDILAAESALLANSDIIGNYQNVVATFHMYDQWVYGGLPRLQDFIEQLNTTLGIPIIIGEYGSYNLGDTIQATQNLYALLQLETYENMGRIAWTWDANDLNDLTTEQSGGGLWIDSCDNPGNLTPLGQLVWDDNHGLK